MELQAMTKVQLIEKVEELSTSLDKSATDGAELKAKAIENEKIIKELRAENESLKNEVKVLILNGIRTFLLFPKSRKKQGKVTRKLLIWLLFSIA